jgi:hypothetical protein
MCGNCYKEHNLKGIYLLYVPAGAVEGMLRGGGTRCNLYLTRLSASS